MSKFMSAEILARGASIYSVIVKMGSWKLEKPMKKGGCVNIFSINQFDDKERRGQKAQNIWKPSK